MAIGWVVGMVARRWYRNGCQKMVEPLLEDGIDMVSRVWQEWLQEDVRNGCQSVKGMVSRG
jgi:hypothetical protein